MPASEPAPAPHQPLPPTEDVVRGLIDAALGRDDARIVRPIEEGGEHFSWWVGPDHVIRLAPDPDTSHRQRREIELRDALRARVGVPLPVSAAVGEWAAGLAYTVDTRLRGTSAELRPISQDGEAQLARMLTGLRSFAIADATALGVPTAAPRSLAELREQAESAARRLGADGEFDGAPPQAPVGEPGPSVLLHNDLKGEHLLVGDDGRIAGVLDWTDAAVGDPAEDIAGLAIAVGAGAAVRVASAAGYGPLLCARGLALARHDTLIRLADRLHGTDDSPIPLLRTQRDHAWAPTALDRPGDDAPDPASSRPWPKAATPRRDGGRTP
ncbi:phosphotransferase family protein [Embleya sp. AB8]|uniref:phosphotransferase family protein n=1 Tax=Embleya sp. AB8 TaxID=3156304 RepID=UPI003C796E63